MKKNNIIRIIYLYLFALVGLAMMVIGGSMLLNLGLKAWVFPKADKEVYVIDKPIIESRELDKEVIISLKDCGQDCGLSEAEQKVVTRWLDSYESWEVGNQERDPDFYIKRNRARQASSAISIILIGLPLWIFHWSLIKKDLKKED